MALILAELSSLYGRDYRLPPPWDAAEEFSELDLREVLFMLGVGVWGGTLPSQTSARLTRAAASRYVDSIRSFLDIGVPSSEDTLSSMLTRAMTCGEGAGADNGDLPLQLLDT
jgi:hypothetical protein